MHSVHISLIQPKEKLEEVLGANSSKYWKTMRMWYKNQVQLIKLYEMYLTSFQ